MLVKKILQEITICEIQLVYKLDNNITKTDIENFNRLMEFGVVNGNKDAYGLFNGFYSFKEKGMFNSKSINKKLLLNDNFIVGHNRWKTSGSEDKNFNNHPFEMGDFVLVHNGVIDNDDVLKEDFKVNHKIETDSFVILWLVNEFYNKSDKNTRDDKIIDSIKRTFKLLEGSISVVIYDRVSKNIYYFKNSRTEFSMMLVDDITLIGSTNQLNLSYVYQDSKKSDFDIKDNHIYRINKEGIFSVGRLKEKKTTTKTYSYCSYSSMFDKEDLSDMNGGYGLIKDKKNDNLKLDFENDVRWEVEQAFYNNLGFIPAFKIKKGNILIDKEDIDKTKLEYLIEKYKEEGVYFKVNLDDFLESNSIWQ